MRKPIFDAESNDKILSVEQPAYRNRSGILEIRIAKRGLNRIVNQNFELSRADAERLAKSILANVAEYDAEPMNEYGAPDKDFRRYLQK